MIVAHRSGIGFDVAPRPVGVIVRGGNGTAGDIYQFDIGNTDASVVHNVAGQPDSGYVSVVDPNAAGVAGGAILCVLMQDISDDESGLAWIEGIVDSAFVIKASGNIAVGDPLVATTSKNLDGTSAQGERYVALALEAKTSPSTRVLAKVWFKGDSGGFGTDGTA